MPQDGKRVGLAALLIVVAAFAGCTESTDDADADDASQDDAADTSTGIDEGDGAVDGGEGMADEGEGMMDEGAGDEEVAPAPVPEAAMGPPIPQDKGYLVEEIAGGLYWVTEGAYQAVFLTTGAGVVVVDAPPNLGAKLLAAIDEVTDEPVTHLIYSHSHADHIASAGLFPEGITIIAHEATAEHLAGDHTGDPEFPFGTFAGGAPVPAPTVTFADEYTLTVGTQTLELKDLGPAHEPGNIFVYAPAQKVLLVIDVFFPGWVPFLGLGLAEDVPAFITAHDQALSYDFETLVSGHLGRLGTRDDIEMQKEYVEDVRQNAAAAMQTVDFMAIAGRVGFANPWLLFGTYFDEVAAECARLTEPAWVGVLGGADVFTESHCFRMMESLRID